MKYVTLFFGVFFLFFSSTSYSQEEKKLSIRGGVTANYFSLENKVNSGHKKTVRYTQVNSDYYTDDYDVFGLGVRLMGAYHISSLWRVGVQGNLFISGGINYILPQFFGHYQTGAFAQYFPIENISVMALLNYTNLHSIKGGLSFGLCPTFYFSKKRKTGIRISTEYFRASETVDYRGFDYDQNNDPIIYSGTAPLITSGFIFELAFTFPFH